MKSCDCNIEHNCNKNGVVPYLKHPEVKKHKNFTTYFEKKNEALYVSI